mgnify:CR=1 FL=1
MAGLSVLGAVQTGAVTAFEFAATLDNSAAATGGFFPPLNGPSPSCNTLNPVPQCYQNPGHKGLRYIHYPGWHQPFFIGWIIINMDLWKSLSINQQNAITRAATDAFTDSWEASNSVECVTLNKILAFNDNQVQLNS